MQSRRLWMLVHIKAAETTSLHTWGPTSQLLVDNLPHLQWCAATIATHVCCLWVVELRELVTYHWIDYLPIENVLAKPNAISLQFPCNLARFGLCFFPKHAIACRIIHLSSPLPHGTPWMGKGPFTAFSWVVTVAFLSLPSLSMLER